MRPMNGFLVVKKDPVPKNIAGIVLAEQNSLRPCSGKVVIPSPSLQEDYPEGTRVLFGKFAGETFSVDGGDPVTLLHQREVQAWIPADVEVEEA